MEKVTIIDNLLTILSVFFSSSLFIYILGSVFAFFVLKNVIVNNGGEMTKKIYYMYFLFVFLLFIVIYSGSILKLWDRLMDNLFLNIYFPSLGIYIGIILVSIVLLLTSLIKKKMPKIVKRINVGSAISIMLLFFLVLDTIVSNKVDVSADMFLYINNKLLALIEVSTGIFALWMIALGIIYCINKISNWFDVKEGQKTNDVVVNVEDNKQPQSTNNYSNLVNNLLEIKEVEKPIKKDVEKDFLINEYKQMREYLMQVKQTNDTNNYFNNIMRDIFTR